MNIDIRKHIVDTFKDASQDEIRASIQSSIEDKDEMTLPGIGVFFEILWENSDDDSRQYVLNTIEKGLHM